MAGKRELKVVILGDSSKAQRAFSQLERSGSNLGNKMGSLGSKVAGVGKAIAAAGVAAGAAATAFGVKALNAASDLNEQISKVGVVFGESAGVVTKFADKMAKDFGLPKAQILEAAGAIGLVGQASGLANKASAELGTKMAGLAADASSFYNIPLEEAIRDISSGLVGQAEPLRKYGVLLSAQAVNAEAARLGLEKVGKEYTEGAKAQARASLITVGMKKATGDLARTQDSFANRMRELRGRVENFSAAVGTKLLPYALKAFDLMQKWAPTVQKLAERVARQLAPAFQAVGRFITQSVIPAVGGLIDWFQTKFLPVIAPVVQQLGQSLWGAFDKIRQVVLDNKEKLREIAEFILLTLLPKLVDLTAQLVDELAPAFQRVIDVAIKVVAWFKDVVKWVDKANIRIGEFKDLVKLFTGNLGFDVQGQTKNITPEQMQKHFPDPRMKGRGATGSWTDNSVNVTVNGGKSDKETGETVAREVSWRRRGWGR